MTQPTVDDRQPSTSIVTAERPASGRISWGLACLVTVVVSVASAAAFPDRISFINDEPRQLAKAWHANADRSLAVFGLQGNFQITYGPTAAHIYQLILLFTHDPLAIATIRAALSAAMTAIGLLWLARSLRLNPWFAAAVSMAPFLWVFHRIIWDASWAIPIGTLGLAAYAGFMRGGKAWHLGLAIFCTLLLPFIHPQDVLLAAPIGLHMLWRHWRSLLRLWPAVLIPLAIVLAVNWPYIQHVRKEMRQTGESAGRLTTTAYPDGVAPKSYRVVSALAPMLSGRILSGYKYVDGGYTTDDPGDRIIRWGKLGSFIIYPLIWLGTGVAVWMLIPRRRRRSNADDDIRRAERRPPVSADTALRGIIAVALGTSLFQMGLFGLKWIPIEPQYFFGTFPAHVVLAWVAVDWLRRYRLAAPSIVVYGASVTAITLGSIWLDSVRPLTGAPRASRPAFLPLGVQVEGVRALNAYADKTVMTDVSFYQEFPHALRSLRLLMAPDAAASRPTHGKLLLTFGDSPAGPETTLVVKEITDPSQVPADAKPLDVTPLPKGWMPGSSE